MKSQKITSLDLEISLQVPETVAEFDQNANKPGACLSEAINNVLYRSTLAEFRDTFLHGDSEKGIKGIDDITGIERKNEKNEKGEITSWKETEGVYFKRVCAEKGVTPASFQEHADRVAAALVFDASSSRKVGTPKKTAKVYLEAADQIIAQGKADAVAAALAKMLEIPVTPDREGIARAISINEARKRQAEQAKMAAGYASLVS